MCQPVPDWTRFVDQASAFCEDPSNPELATATLEMLEACTENGLPERSSVVPQFFAKLGYQMAIHQPGLCQPFGWPLLVSTILLLTLGDLELVQQILDEVAAELGCVPWQVAPIPGRPVYFAPDLDDDPWLYRPIVSELSVTCAELQLIHAWAITNPETAARMREMAGHGEYIIHLYSPLVEVASQVCRAFNEMRKVT